MSDRDPLQVDIQVLTRALMTTGTLPSSVGPWTYHHILPVRIYYMTAALMLRVVLHPDCWTKTRALVIDSLESMCNNGPNKAFIRLFVTNNVGAAVTHDQIRDCASRCSNPPFGGFAGPNPNQRTDDPHDNEELLRPRSIDQGRWDSVKLLRDYVYGAMNIVAVPPPNTLLSATKRVFEWCALVESMRGSIDFATLVGSARFDAADWMITADTSQWIFKPAPVVRAVPVVRPPLRIRGSGDRKQLVDYEGLGYDDATRRAAATRRNMVSLGRDGDYLAVVV